jgi:hypothetical protein
MAVKTQNKCDVTPFRFYNLNFVRQKIHCLFFAVQ